MYTHTTAARISHSWLDSELSYAPAAPRKVIVTPAGSFRSRVASRIASTDVPSETPARGVEADRRGRVLRHVRDLQRRAAFHDVGHRGERRGLARRGAQLHRAEGGGRGGGVGPRLQDHAVLVGLREDGRDDALAEGAVQRGVDVGGGDVQARGRVAVDVHVHRGAGRIRIGHHVAHLPDRLQLLREARGPLRDGGGVGAFERQPVLRGAGFGVDGQVLRGLQVQGDAGHALGALAQAVHHLLLVAVAALQVDQHAAGVQHGVVGGVHADEAAQRLDVRVFHQPRARLPAAAAPSACTRPIATLPRAPATGPCPAWGTGPWESRCTAAR